MSKLSICHAGLLESFLSVKLAICQSYLFVMLATCHSYMSKQLAHLVPVLRKFLVKLPLNMSQNGLPFCPYSLVRKDFQSPPLVLRTCPTRKQAPRRTEAREVRAMDPSTQPLDLRNQMLELQGFRSAYECLVPVEADTPMADAPAMEASTPKPEGTSQTVEGGRPRTDPLPDQDMDTDTENVISEDKTTIHLVPAAWMLFFASFASSRDVVALFMASRVAPPGPLQAGLAERSLKCGPPRTPISELGTSCMRDGLVDVHLLCLPPHPLIVRLSKGPAAKVPRSWA